MTAPYRWDVLASAIVTSYSLFNKALFTLLYYESVICELYIGKAVE